MGKIIAIGGGEIRNQETLYIDKKIILTSQKKNPKLLFIPTASYDSEGYIEFIKSYFGNKLGCIVDILYLSNSQLSQKDIENKILNADIIYTGGGNTLRMINYWKKFKIDKILKKAFDKNIILSGLSAGAICRFGYGSSDSRKYKDSSNKFTKVTGLGFINALLCPHYGSENNRENDLKRMMKKVSCIGIALEDGCAIEIVDKKYRIISNKKDSNAYKVYWSGNKFIKHNIKEQLEYSDIQQLLRKE